MGGEAGGVGDVSPGSLDIGIRHDGSKRRKRGERGMRHRSGSVTGQSRNIKKKKKKNKKVSIKQVNQQVSQIVRKKRKAEDY